MSPKRRIAFAALTVVLVFGLVETVMHVLAPEGSGREQGFVGHSTAVPYFVADERQGLLVPNRAEMSRFSGLALQPTAGRIRVATVGGSTIASPPPDGPSWQLAAMLVLGAGGRAELLNGGGHGFGSTRARGVFEELRGHKLNAVVLYAGHNEFAESRYVPSLSLQGGLGGLLRQVRRHSRVYEMVRLGLRDLRGAPHLVAAEVPGGPVRPGEMTRLNARFRDNLEAMAEAMQQDRIAAVWVLPASSLGVAPEASDDGQGFFGVAGLAEHLERALASGDTVAAGRLSAEILEQQPRHALAHFARGRGLAAAGDLDGALLALRQARDEDQVPRRATSQLIATMREVAERYGFAVVDAEAVLLARDLERTLAGGYGADRMHLDAVGYRLVMLAVYEALRTQLGGLISSRDIEGSLPDPGASLETILGPHRRTVTAPRLSELEHRPRDTTTHGEH